MKKDDKKLVMHLPPEIATALSRRHHGREDITKNEIIDASVQMQLLWIAYQKAKDKLDYIDDVWWDEKQVEKHFMESSWYYAHRKRKKAETLKGELHKKMFYLLVHTDGNYEPFSFDAMSAEDIYDDFTGKYTVTN